MTDPALELTHRVEERRQRVSARLSAGHRAKLGQFFTPSATAAFLAGLLELPAGGSFRVLDPGAGVASLSAAVVSRVIAERPDLELHVVAFEVDDVLIPDLTQSLEDCVTLAATAGCRVTYEVRSEDFVEYATGGLLAQPETFDAVIANPPYKKVSTSAPERVGAQSRGLRASNLYTIFVGLAADLLAPAGQMSAIIPRS